MSTTKNIIAANGTELLRYDWDVLASMTLDMLFEKPDGVTLVQLVERLDVPEHIARRAINNTRELLSKDTNSHENIIAVPYGRERRYQLVMEPGEETEGWLAFNRKYVNSRLATVEQVYACLVRGAKSEEERDAAQRILKAVIRLKEDVEDMERVRPAGKGN